MYRNFFKKSQRNSHLWDSAEAENFGVLDLPHVGKAIRHQCQCVSYELVQTPQSVLSDVYGQNGFGTHVSDENTRGVM